MRILVIIILACGFCYADPPQNKNTFIALIESKSTKSETFIAKNQLHVFLMTSSPLTVITRSNNFIEITKDFELQNNDLVFIPQGSEALVSIPHLNTTHSLLSGNNLIIIEQIKYIKLNSGDNIKVPFVTASIGNGKRNHKSFIVSHEKYSYFNNTRSNDPNYKLH